MHILSDDSSADYVSLDASGGNGLLLFRREGTLMGVPFDLRRLRINGEVFPIMEGVGVSGNTQSAAFSVSNNGMLAYGSGSDQPRWRRYGVVDRTGKRLGGVGQPGRILGPVAGARREGNSVQSSSTIAGDASDHLATGRGARRAVPRYISHRIIG